MSAWRGTRPLRLAWATAWNDDANRLLAPLLRIAALLVVAMPAPPFQPLIPVAPAAGLTRQAVDQALAWAKQT